ncbi:hypothetical protein [Nonomuraea aurantiaca]|uniref:hypothetical protein n=1 Tax=Nonomuraea aurantiaca TaxID=2878562 RepID=UPI001CD9A4B0|nr:hypothetical protein [Nonomuraea aurantiaca]MCA2224916.1 hypothetical protein [Nonomuraea aurantiaca]
MRAVAAAIATELNAQTQKDARLGNPLPGVPLSGGGSWMKICPYSQVPALTDCATAGAQITKLVYQGNGPVECPKTTDGLLKTLTARLRRGPRI